MLWHALLLFLTTATVARARQQKVPWEDIFAYPSQWLHFVILGGPFEHTFSSCVGQRVRDGHRHRKLWLTLQFILDTVFWLKERNHCAESLHRTEKHRRQWT